jgi:hypothetical protein
MDYNTAKILLDKYWNCETSLKEEDLLRSYFNQDHVPDDLQKYKALFNYYNEERGKELPKEFDKKVLNRINKSQKKGTQHFLNSIYKIAAAVLLILSFFVIHERFIKVKDQATKVVEDTFGDPEKALEETKKILYFVSEKLNKGKEEASRLNKFNKAEEVVRKSNYKEI